MTIKITFISSVQKLIFGTVDGITYGTKQLAIAEGKPDPDNVYPH